MESYNSRHLLSNLAPTDSPCLFFFPGLDFFGVFICEAHLVVEIFLDELESFPAGLEEDVIKFRDHCARAHFLEQLPRSDLSHFDH